MTAVRASSDVTTMEVPLADTSFASSASIEAQYPQLPFTRKFRFFYIVGDEDGNVHEEVQWWLPGRGSSDNQPIARPYSLNPASVIPTFLYKYFGAYGVIRLHFNILPS
jgi:hypothetical protein